MGGDYLNDVLEGREFLLFDGAMGTMLQKSGLGAGELPDLLCLTNPEAVTDIHRAYVEAGSKVVTTNTFGANELKLGSDATVEEVYAAAVGCARDSGARLVAADIGPTGELLFPMGDMGFSDAYGVFARQARAAEAAGADLIIIETMTDVLEMTAAVLASKDASALPVFATMTFTASGRTFMGTTPAAAALTLAALGVDALGVNCSAGPEDLQPVVKQMIEVSPVPVIVQANAGLPEVVDGQTVYGLPPADYARAVAPMVQAGATIVGGCCGTDQAYISAVADLLKGQEPKAQLVSEEHMRTVALEAADEGGRDAEILEMVLEASGRASLKEALVEEYD